MASAGRSSAAQREDETMAQFPVHTVETAPAAAREFLQGLEKGLGRLPNLAAAMAESPGLLRGFFTVREIYFGGTLGPLEVHALSITNAVANNCAWCVAFHTAMALKDGLPREVVEALRDGRPPGDRRLAALSEFSRALITRRGAATEEEKQRFFAAGFTPGQALEVVLGNAFSLMANYAGHVTGAPLDAALEPHAWAGAAVAA
jgi:AhpD family alkylhydroperoxidase